MGEAIVITSGKGGVGKTTTSANLGTALAIQGKKVCLVDTDIGLRNLDVVMGLENRIIYDLSKCDFLTKFACIYIIFRRILNQSDCLLDLARYD